MKWVKKYLISSFIIVFLFSVFQLKANKQICYEDLHEDIEYITQHKNIKDSVYLNKLLQVASCFNKLELPDLNVRLFLKQHKIKDFPKAYKGDIYLILGRAYEQKRNFKVSRTYYKKAMNFFSKKEKNRRKAAQTAVKLAEMYMRLGKYHETLLFADIAKKYAAGLPDSANYLCQANYLGFHSMLNFDEPTKARKFLIQLENIGKIDKKAAFYCNIKLADAFLSVNKPDSAFLFIQRAKSDSILDLKEYYLLLASYYNYLNDERNFFKYLDKVNEFIKQKHDLILAERDELAENEAFLKLYDTLNQEEEGFRFSTLLYYGVLAFFIIILIIIIFIVQSQKKKADEQKKEIDRLNKSKEVVKREISQYNLNFEKKLEEKKERHQKQLDEEIVENEQSIQELNEKIKHYKKVVELRNKLLLQLNYNIKSLLSNILGFSNILKTKFANSGQTDLFSYTENIENSSKRFLDIVNVFSDYVSVISEGIKPNLSLVSVGKVLNKILDELNGLIEFNKIKVVVNQKKQFSFFTDEQLFIKLLNTAIEVAINNTYRGYINIKVEYSEKKGVCAIRITNTGKGFDKAYLKDILEPYSRDGLSYIPGFNGSGMEFPLLKRLANILKGDYEISSDIGKGITQTIVLPAKKVLFEQKKPKKESDDKELEIPWENKKVLVVEDDRLNQLLFEKMLNKASLIKIASDGEKAMGIIDEFFSKGEVFDLVLMDINLPTPWDGIQLKNKIKKFYNEYEKVPFVAQTAYAMQGDRERFLNEGFDEYIAKPIVRTELIKVVSRVMKN